VDKKIETIEQIPAEIHALECDILNQILIFLQLNNATICLLYEFNFNPLATIKITRK